MKKSAFTLIELLVVVAVIGFLVVVVFLGLNSIRGKSRDVKRISDITQIQKALEIYHNDNNSYPQNLTPGASLVGAVSGETYIKKIPTAPNTPDGECTSDAYTYDGTNYNTTYTLSYCLGGVVQSAGPGNSTAVPGQIYTPSAGGGGGGGSSNAECSAGVCGDGTDLTCGASDFVANDSLALNSGNATAYSAGGVTYQAIKIGTQCWLDKNLNLGTMVLGVSGDNLMTNDGLIEKWCFDDIEANCTSDGALYHWSEAMNLPNACNSSSSDDCAPTAYLTGSGASAKRQGLCPVGWHIPSDREFSVMEDYVDRANISPAIGAGVNYTTTYYADQIDTGGIYGYRGNNNGTKLKCNSWNGSAWITCGASNMKFPLLGGWSDGFDWRTSFGYYWTASQEAPGNSWINGFSTGAATGSWRDWNYKSDGNGVRCLKD